MKRVLYNTSVVDPFLNVAKKLQNEKGYEPVYWIGFDYDHSEELVPAAFPGICYQSYPDAWKGIFSDEIAKKAADSYLDVDFLNDFARFELQAIKMMDRMDFDRYSFNYMERERHYLKLLKSWMAVIDMYKIDIVISSVNPHRVYDYVLYLLCKKKNIKFICFQYSMCPGRIYALDNIFTIGDMLDMNYQKYLKVDNLTKDSLPDDIRKQYDKVQKSYDEAQPYYMKAHQSNAKKNNNAFYFGWIYLKKKGLFGKEGILSQGKVTVTMRKNRKYSLEDSKDTLWEAANRQRVKLKFIKKMRDLYDSFATPPIGGEKYVFLPLHYQPEATTSPAGDIFVNQTLCVETLLKNLPEDYFVYIKEHPQQLQSHTLGQTSRIETFYSDLLKSKRVRLMPLEMDSYSLMRNAAAVATVTGTVGWEALMHRIPVIVFGLIWYEKMPGVLRITDSASGAKIKDFIDNYTFDEKKVLAYLMAFSEKSIRAYHYEGYKQLSNIDEETCVRNIVDYLDKIILP